MTTDPSDAPETSWHVTAEVVRELIGSLNHWVFHAGADRFAEEFGLPKSPAEVTARYPEKMSEYRRHLNWSLKEAQRRIIDARQRLERSQRSKSLQIDPPYSFPYLMRLLTDYTDSIAWGMLEYDLSWVRSQFLDPKSHSALDANNWESIEKILTIFNADPDQFMLATDLTSFMHVGDVFLRNTATGAALALEVKAGKVNGEVLEVLSSENEQQFGERLKAFVARSSKPQHAIKQVERNLKQQMRLAASRTYTESGNSERVDLKTERRVRVFESDEDQSWHDVVVELAEHLGPIDATNGVVDECLFFEYGAGQIDRKREFYFRYRLSQHIGLSLEPADLAALAVYDVARQTALPCFLPQSTNLMKLGEERQARLLALDDHLLVYLHVPLLVELLEKYGVTLATRNMKIEEQHFGDPLTRDVFGANQVPYLMVGDPEILREIGIGGGVTGRILFNFMSPAMLLDFLKTSLSGVGSNGASPETPPGGAGP